jgi:hypothetical protein
VFVLAIRMPFATHVRACVHTGSWGCFDEFNRLVPEVLSVCSVQVCRASKRVIFASLCATFSLSGRQFKAVCDSIRAGRADTIIEGDRVFCDPTAGVFITMNPVCLPDACSDAVVEGHALCVLGVPRSLGAARGPEGVVPAYDGVCRCWLLLLLRCKMCVNEIIL